MNNICVKIEMMCDRDRCYNVEKTEMGGRCIPCTFCSYENIEVIR